MLTEKDPPKGEAVQRDNPRSVRIDREEGNRKWGDRGKLFSLKVGKWGVAFPYSLGTMPPRLEEKTVVAEKKRGGCHYAKPLWEMEGCHYGN